jgi:hypothetical protein
MLTVYSQDETMTRRVKATVSHIIVNGGKPRDRRRLHKSTIP